jgi:hypothetical protein
MYLLFVDIVCILFAVFSGLHDTTAVNNFEYFGDIPRREHEQQGRFHRFNLLMKWVVAIGVSFSPLFYFHEQEIPITDLGLGFLAGGCLIWAVFDPVVSIFRMKDLLWWYISPKNYIDRKLIEIFGSYAGIWKFIILLLIVILCHLAYYNQWLN